jgi:hypothetical protein
MNETQQHYTEEYATYAIEEMIDKWGLSHFTSVVSDICWEKSLHLRANWQDSGAARVWERQAKRFDSLSAKIEKDCL